VSLRMRLVSITLLMMLTAPYGCDTSQRPTGAAPPSTGGGLPAVSGSAAGVPVTLPGDLRHPWIRSSAPEPGFADDHAAIFEILPDGATVGFGEDLVSSVTRWDGATLGLSLVVDGFGCRAGDDGTFDLAVSPTGRRMTIKPIDDDCAARADRLSGTWLKSDCPAFPENFCLGDLDPGRYGTTYFTPFVPMERWALEPGAMTYEVPTGWANTWDVPDEFHLKPHGSTDGSAILMWNALAVVSRTEPCSPKPDTSVSRSPAAMASWIATQPTLETTQPAPVVIDGLEGFVVDATTAPGTLPCVGHGRYAPIFVHPDATGLQWGLAAGEQARFYLLDIGGERSLIIEITAPDRESFDWLLSEAQRIVMSLKLRRYG
jgi:hypothetical protein